MSERPTRTNLDAEPEGSRTDWARLKALGDDAIDQAIASDPDTYEVETVPLGRVGASYRYVLYHSEGKWRWYFENAKGEIIAGSPRRFDSRAEAEKAVASLRKAILGASARAA